MEMTFLINGHRQLLGDISFHNMWEVAIHIDIIIIVLYLFGKLFAARSCHLFGKQKLILLLLIR